MPLVATKIGVSYERPMVIRRLSDLPTPVTGRTAPKISAYEAFRRAHPEFVEHVIDLRRDWRSRLQKLRDRPRSSQHHDVRRLLRMSSFRTLFAFDALKRADRLRHANTQTVEMLASRFDPFSPVEDERVVLRSVTRGPRPRVVQEFGPVRRMHQLAVDAILRSLHPPREQLKLFNGGMPKALRAIEEAYTDGYTHCCEVDFVNFYGSVRLEGLPELMRPLPLSVTQHVVWDLSSREPISWMNGSMPTSEMPGGLSLGSATSPIVGEIIISHLLAAAQLSDVISYADNLLVLGRSEGEVQARINRLRDCIASADPGISGLRFGDFEIQSMEREVFFSSHVGEPNDGAFQWSPSQRKLEDFMASARDYVSLDQINRAIAQVSSWRRYYDGWPDGERKEAEFLATLMSRRFALQRTPQNCAAAVSAITDAFVIWEGSRGPEDFMVGYDGSYDPKDATDAPHHELLTRVNYRLLVLDRASHRHRIRRATS